MAERSPGSGTERRKPDGDVIGKRLQGSERSEVARQQRKVDRQLRCFSRPTLRGLRRKTRPVERRSTPRGAKSAEVQDPGESPRQRAAGRTVRRRKPRNPLRSRNEATDLSVAQSRRGSLRRRKLEQRNPEAEGRRKGVPADPLEAGGAARFRGRRRKAKAGRLGRKTGGAHRAPRPDARQAERSWRRERGMRDEGRFG